jgi:F-type H+/Na+-transporting ATPase subunit alpha
MRSEGKDILSTIRDEKALSDGTRAKLKDAVDTFAKNFA